MMSDSYDITEYASDEEVYPINGEQYPSSG